MAKKKNSSKPSGMKVTRNGDKFICEWKIPSAGYGDGQKFKATSVSAASIGKTTTKKTVTINLNRKFPLGAKLTSFSFSVQGNSNKKKSDNLDWSGWATKTVSLGVPAKPTFTTELKNANTTRFTWNVAGVKNSSMSPFHNIVIQTALVKDWNGALDKIPSGYWHDYVPNNTYDYTSTQSGYISGANRTSAASGWVEITENSGTLANGNYVRVCRIRAQGCAGNTKWTYASHVYGTPQKSSVSDDPDVNETSNGYDVKVNWNTSYNRSTPIDESVAEWVIAKPESDMSCPPGVTWNAGQPIKESRGGESFHLDVNARLGVDQCLYVRVKTKHDSNYTYSDIILAKVGKLKPPNGITVENVDKASQTAKITASNESEVDGTQLEVIYRKNDSETVVGMITGSPSYLTVKCPAWEDTDKVSFGVRAVLPEDVDSTTEDGVTIYTVTPYMESDIVWQPGSVAAAPSNLTLALAGDDVMAKWTNNWEDANLLELSWNDNPNSWESTDEPQTFEIDNPFATSWRIANLDTGKTWYVKIRAIYDSGNGRTYSPYSNRAEIGLSSSPDRPVLDLSQGVVAIGQGFTASWEYNSTDGTPQDEAKLYTYDSANDEYTFLAKVDTQETVDLPGWDSSGMRMVAVEVTSASGCTSNMSAPVPILVAEPVTCSMSTSLETVTVTDDDSTTRQVTALTSLPMTINVSGAGDGGMVSVVIKRKEPFHLERPDESEWDGYKDEVIYEHSQVGSDEITITLDDAELVGTFDDDAEYTIIATVTDDVGQQANEEVDFVVIWSQQALAPSGRVIVDQEQKIAVLIPEAPAGTRTTDRCDLYRLSADKPVLIYKNAEFGSKYVDPYPAMGEESGYRFVFMTKDGDYTTAENVIAFYDAEEEHLKADCVIIDFDGERVELRYDLTMSSDFKKNFKEVTSLGGAVRGYWNDGVSRKGNVSGTIVPVLDEDILDSLRRLSEHKGICHVRTPEGSSFTADVQVSESWDNIKIAEPKLTIVRVDPEELDGMTYEEWESEQA